LVNSADLKSNGRNVQCANCGHNWFQTTLKKDESFTNLSNDKNINENKIDNLPSTFVKQQNSSIINSCLILLFLLIVFMVFLLLKNNVANFLVLMQFYLMEFYFNLKMIINDLSKIIYQIIN